MGWVTSRGSEPSSSLPVTVPGVRTLLEGTWSIVSATSGPAEVSAAPRPTSALHGEVLANRLTCRCQTVDGGWSRWSTWSRCDQRCGGGRSIRTRSCSSPPPKNGGKKCVGEKNQVKPCNTKPCGEAERNTPCVDYCDLSTSSTCTQTKPH